MQENTDIFWVNAGRKHIAAMLGGEFLKARFKLEGSYPNWVGTDVDGCDLTLRGWERGAFIASDGAHWELCQVYDPPKRYADKPEPGEGYRLLEKNPAEALQPGDEGLGSGQNPKWFPSEQAKIGGRQVERVWYRRKLEPAEFAAKIGDKILLPNGKVLIVTANGVEIE